MAADEGADERTIVTRISRVNKGASSIKHSMDRVDKFKQCQREAKTHLQVVLGFCLSGDGRLAFRRATEGVGVGIDPSSTGAPPGTEEVAKEVGRPMARLEMQGQPRASLTASEGQKAAEEKGIEWPKRKMDWPKTDEPMDEEEDLSLIHI